MLEKNVGVFMKYLHRHAASLASGCSSVQRFRCASKALLDQGDAYR